MKLTYDEMTIASIALRDRSDSLGGVEEMLKLADKLDKARGVREPCGAREPCPRARPGQRRCSKCRPLNEPARCTERGIGMNMNRCALPKNHGGACRAPRTGDRVRWKKLGIYEKDWPK